MGQRRSTFLRNTVMLGWAIATAAPAAAQCPAEPPLQNFTGGGSVVCPCFAVGEQAGAVFELPPEMYPIEILRVGVGWGSTSGANPQSLEEAIHVYGAGLPTPGAPIFSLAGPVLTDGGINEFDLEPEPGEIVINSGPFMVALEFLNANEGIASASSVVHDGNGCQAGKNSVYANFGGGLWVDACALGVSGDWVFTVTYRPLSCGPTGAGTVPDGSSGAPLTVNLNVGGNLTLLWSPSCAAGDDDYEVYEGTLGTFYSHASVLCTTSGATGAVITPAPGNTYYVVVPRNTDREGSYGLDGEGTERPPGAGQCLAQDVAACP